MKTYLKNINGKSRLFIFSCCTNLIRELKTYRWGAGDNPIKKDDHCLDELRYYIMSLCSEKSKFVSKTEIQKDKEKLFNNLKRK